MGVGSLSSRCFWLAGFFSSQSGVCEAKRNPATSPLGHSSGPEVPSWPAFFCPPFRRSLHLFYTPRPGFLVECGRRNMERYVHSALLFTG